MPHAKSELLEMALGNQKFASEFDAEDWEMFSGCESKYPSVFYDDGNELTFVYDGNRIEVMSYDCEEEVTFHRADYLGFAQ